MFVGRCYTDQNTPSIWRRLVVMGLKPQFTNDDASARGKFLVADRGCFYDVDEASEGFADCRGNLRRFLAVSALRTDSDIYQWFICDTRFEPVQRKCCFWFQCGTDDVYDDEQADGMQQYCTKATLADLLEYL